MSQPSCVRCRQPIVADQLAQKAVGTFHSSCFVCSQCKQPIVELPQHLTLGAIANADWNKVLCLTCHRSSIPVPPPKRSNRSVSPAPVHSASALTISPEPTRRRSLSTGANSQQPLQAKHSASSGNISSLDPDIQTRPASLSVSSHLIAPRRQPPKAPPPLETATGFTALSSLLGWKQASKKPKAVPTPSPTNNRPPPPPPPDLQPRQSSNGATAFSPPPEASVLPLLYLELAEKQASLNRLNYLEDRCPWLITAKDIERMATLKSEIKELSESVKPANKAPSVPSSPLGRLSVLKIISNFETQPPTEMHLRRAPPKGRDSVTSPASGTESREVSLTRDISLTSQEKAALALQTPRRGKGEPKSSTPQSRGDALLDDPPLLSLMSLDSDPDLKHPRASENHPIIKQLEMAKADVEQRAFTLEQQLEEAKRTCAAYEKQLEELRTSVSQLETRDAESKEEIAALKRKAAMQNVPDQQAKGNQTTKTVKKLQEEISDLNYNLYYGNTQKDKEIQTLKIRLQQQAEGEAHQQEVAKWKTKFQDFQQQAFEDWLMNAGDVSLELY